VNKQKKILIVDDNACNVELVTAFLEKKFNFIVLKAYGGEEGLELAEKEHPDLILLDIMMPRLNGFQVCEELRKDNSFAATPVIFVTAKDEEKDIIKALEVGGDDYIMKPVVRDDLIEKVANLLSKAESGELPSQSYKKVQKELKEGKIKSMADHSCLCNSHGTCEEEKK